MSDPTESTMKKLDPEVLQRVLVAVASAEGFKPDDLNLALELLSIDKEALKAEVAQEIRQEIIDDLEPEADGGFEPTFDGLESDRTIKMGVGAYETEVKIRWMVSVDGERIAQMIPDLIRYIYKAGPKALQGLSPLQLLNDVLVLFSKPKARADFKAAIYKELSYWLTCGDQKVTPDFLREKCQPGQIVRAAIATFQVNQVFFTDLWAALPGQVTGPLNMLAGQIIASTRNLAQLNWDYQALLNGIGTTPTGGIPSGLIPSLQSMGGLPQLLGQWISPLSGDTKRPSTDATTVLGTSSGLTARTRNKGRQRVKKENTPTDPPATPKQNGKRNSKKQTKTAPIMPSSSESLLDTSPDILNA